ncbi:MAG: transcriptional regulator, partial [Burkholderiaceae bacterium]|nr:transcriptional regulator [Burkholderiaceae bacterium]
MDAVTKPAKDAMDISLMRQNADHACRMMKTLANRDRLMLLCQLSQG